MKQNSIKASNAPSINTAAASSLPPIMSSANNTGKYVDQKTSRTLQPSANTNGNTTKRRKKYRMNYVQVSSTK